MGEDERFPGCVLDKRCVLLFGHENSCVGRKVEEESESSLDIVADIGDFANGVASLVVGHLKILSEGGFSHELAEVMCQALHAKLLGLDIWDHNGVSDFDGWPDLEENDDAD